MKHIISVLMLCAICVTLFCSRHPVSPVAGPDEVSIVLIRDGIISPVELGKRFPIGVCIYLAEFVEAVHIWSGCGDFDTTLYPDQEKIFDTLLLEPVFTKAGLCTLYARAIIFGAELYGEKKDSLTLEVKFKEPRLVFTNVPHSLTAIAGRPYTFNVAARTECPTPIRFSFVCEPPLDADHFYALNSVTSDTAGFFFWAGTADSFTITAYASAGACLDSVKFGIRTCDPPAFASVNIPSKVIVGIADTLIFIADQKSGAGSMRLDFINRSAYDTSTVKLLPANVDSLLIVLIARSEGPYPISVRLTDGVVSDTSWFTVTAVEPAYAVWNCDSASCSATENMPLAVDLRRYLFGSIAQDLYFSSDLGRISRDTVWKWTPPWGCDTSVVSIIRAENDKGVNLFYIYLSIEPADTSPPSIKLVDASFFDKTLLTSRITVEVAVMDSESGVKRVCFEYGTKTADAVHVGEGIYAVEVDSLLPGVRTEIRATAYDCSMRKNRSTLRFFLTYDSTLIDTTPPSIVRLEDPVDADIRITKSNALSPDTIYYWQVVGYTHTFPDTVRSEMYSFTTGGRIPEFPVVNDTIVER